MGSLPCLHVPLRVEISPHMAVTNFNVGLSIQGRGMYTPEEENDSVACARCYMDLIKQGDLTANIGSVPMSFWNL